MRQKIKQMGQKITPNWCKVAYYQLLGRRPWSTGYFTVKTNFITEIIGHPEAMKKFKNREPLPQGYGYALDVRVVEHPWVLAKLLDTKEGAVLDAGSSMNYDFVLEHEALRNKKITIVNLEPEEDCYWQKGVSYLFADIRNLPYKNESFDYVTSISTFQHIGMNNNFYYSDNRKYGEQKLFDFEKAIRELSRVLKKDGKLFMSVPFGQYQNFGWLQQFDSERLGRLITAFNPKNHQVTFYKYTQDGWNLSDEKSCQDAIYFDHRTAQGCDNPDFNLLLAAGSTAVACIEMIK